MMLKIIQLKGQNLSWCNYLDLHHGNNLEIVMGSMAHRLGFAEPTTALIFGFPLFS